MGNSNARKAVIAALGFGLTGGMALADAACAPGRVDLRWQGGRESFAVEVADDQQERARGLMAREAMDTAAGMLFVYETPRRAQFWMKDTLIPLDMIFADATGLVTRVHSNAVPQDLTPIDGGNAVRFVLEINGGLAAKLGIVPGAVLRHPTVGSGAAWPCAE